MCLIKILKMKYLFLLILALCATACFTIEQSQESFFEDCPYELKYGRNHYLEVPISIIPNQVEYKIGDTITFQMLFPDSIYDLSREVSFKIKNFPFEPINTFYKINNDSWESGYRVNSLNIDDVKYKTRYNTQSSFSDDMRGFTVYEDGFYKFEYVIVMETSGKYCTLISDQYQENLGGNASKTNDDADAVEFDGRCNTDFFICSTVNGNDNIEEFLEELEFLDKEVFRDNLVDLEGKYDEYFGSSGSITLEWNGVFCFEVVE